MHEISIIYITTLTVNSSWYVTKLYVAKCVKFESETCAVFGLGMKDGHTIAKNVTVRKRPQMTVSLMVSVTNKILEFCLGFKIPLTTKN